MTIPTTVPALAPPLEDVDVSDTTVVEVVAVVTVVVGKVIEVVVMVVTVAVVVHGSWPRVWIGNCASVHPPHPPNALHASVACRSSA